MSILTAAVYDILSADATLIGMLATYKGSPAIFTIDPAPGDAMMPYIVTAGEISQSPFDTKNSRGREAMRDIRCYAEPDGSTIIIEAIAERVRYLLHRQPITIAGFNWMISDCTGPLAADEVDAYGRVISLRIIAMEN